MKKILGLFILSFLMHINFSFASLKDSLLGTWQVVNSTDTSRNKNIEAEYYTFKQNGILQQKICYHYLKDNKLQRDFRDTVYKNIKFKLKGNLLKVKFKNRFYSDGEFFLWDEYFFDEKIIIDNNNLFLESEYYEDSFFVRYNTKGSFEEIIKPTIKTELKKVNNLSIVEQQHNTTSLGIQNSKPIDFNKLTGTWVNIAQATSHRIDYYKLGEIVSFYEDSTYQFCYVNKNNYRVYQKDGLVDFSYKIDTTGLYKKTFSELGSCKIEERKIEVKFPSGEGMNYSNISFLNDSIIQMNGWQNTKYFYKKINTIPKQKSWKSKHFTQEDVTYEIINCFDSTQRFRLDSLDNVDIQANSINKKVNYGYESISISSDFEGINDTTIFLSHITSISKYDSLGNFIESASYDYYLNKTLTLNTNDFSILITKEIRASHDNWYGLSILTEVVGLTTALVVAPLISIKYKSPLEFNSHKYFNIEAYSLTASLVGLIGILISKERKKTFEIATTKNSNSTNFWRIKRTMNQK
jgi:hypothetical protein